MTTFPRQSLLIAIALGGSWMISDRPRFAAVACFVLAMPNRYLPILQEGKIESLRKK